MWTLSKNDLLPSTLLELKEDEKHLSGISIDFHPTEKEKYICGTEEGKLFKCSTKYSSQYLDEFKAHDGAIMSIKWNQFHPDVFATSSQVNFISLYFLNIKSFLGLESKDLE